MLKILSKIRVILIILLSLHQLNKKTIIMKKNLTYILKNLRHTFGIKFGIIELGTVVAIVKLEDDVDEEHFNSDMQIYCAKFGYTWSGLQNNGHQKFFTIYSF